LNDISKTSFAESALKIKPKTIKQWADMVITQVGQFPKGKHDDLVDTVSMAMRHLRDTGSILRPEEWRAEAEDALSFKGNASLPSLYPI
jgi:hypothetical protein